MLRTISIIFLSFLVVTGCAVKGKTGHTGGPAAASSASGQDMKEQLRQVLKDNPQLVMDVLAENKIELSAMVEEGFIAKRKKARDDRMVQELNNPLEPKIDQDRPMLGKADAPITIVEYTDFQCPYCGQAAQTVREVLKRNPGKVRVFFKHVPLHDMSLRLAMYFEALARQDKDMAWKFHDLAFAHRKELAEDKDKAIARILREVKPDMKRLEQDLQNEAIQAAIESDISEAQDFGFRGTPVFVVNGVSVVGAQPVDEFERVMGLVQAKQKADKGKKSVSGAKAAKPAAKDSENCPTCLNK